MDLNVLVIDDSGLMRKMILRALRQSEVSVGSTLEAANGEEGLRALQANEPDLILCDWNMPVMDGLEFVRRSQGCEVPVIMLTTESTSDRKARAINAGAKGYVTKPFTPEKLGEAIRAVMSGNTPSGAR